MTEVQKKPETEPRTITLTKQAWAMIDANGLPEGRKPSAEIEYVSRKYYELQDKPAKSRG